MASHSRSLMQDVLAALRQAHAHQDLSTVSGTKRVVIDQGEPPVLSGPWVVLSAPEVKQDEGSITPLVMLEIEGTVEWTAFVPSDLESTEERAFDALDLAHDIVKALRTAHATPGTYATLGACHYLAFSPVKISGDASIEELSYGIAYGSFTYRGYTEGGI
jgi:hypothetical protein